MNNSVEFIAIFMTVFTIILIPTAIVIIQKKRKGLNNVYGIMGYVTPACFLLIPIIGVLSYWFNFMVFSSLFHWGINLVLFIVAVYFTKFLPVPEETSS
ncbi:hypothetical protein [Texcoconibacillus texcoconensis]|uniref:Amino acid transporter n=1 Tax=Texcoconibacillus texcoconensis TaxID=1095777 RepID=A0A840QKM4_9BACI|nr:hypothetical protein [Texcoconibacillus texcoconensis]MBB5171947.1 amino acid transporter [Texcoconibacillus texcoconensis]